jgi:hypothetical protein
MNDVDRVLTRSERPVGLAMIATFLLALPSAPSAQRSYGPGVCGPIDPTYVRVATETGGQPFPMAPTEIAKTAVVMSESSRSDASMLLWASGTTADANGGLAVPVDTSVTRVMFTVTFDGKGGRAAIVAPDGSIIEPGAAAGDAILNCGRVLSIDAPAAGVWRVRPSPTERFWVVVHGRSERDRPSATFVHAGGRPGHDGLFPIHGMPIAGRPAMLRVRLSEPEWKSPSFLLISSQGREIQRLALDRLDADEFAGELTLPAVPFRVAVAGTDEHGAPYQRLHRGLFRAESVEVVPSSQDELKAGEDAALAFIVRNHGPRARYRIVVTVGAEMMKRVEPPLVELDPDTEQPITVRLPAATIDAAGTSLELVVVASRDDQASASFSANSAIQRLTVVKH